ncbi:hypothetical protein J6590_027008 [Homalodisca vitripennis]|nr:hypothetical protein J6590_027008 [Homalodisca vitripennis]
MAEGVERPESQCVYYRYNCETPCMCCSPTPNEPFHFDTTRSRRKKTRYRPSLSARPSYIIIGRN